MWAQSGMKLACKLVVESAGRMTIVFDLRRVDGVVVVDHCMMEDRVDHCSFKILHSI